MNTITANVIAYLAVYGLPSLLVCASFYANRENWEKNRQERLSRKRQEHNNPEPIPAHTPPLPKPLGCTDQRYKDPEKELERCLHKIACGLDPNQPYLGIDRVQVQQYLRGKNN